MGDSKSIGRLFQRYLDNECTPEEIKILLHYFDAGADEDVLRHLIRQQLAADNEGQHTSEPLLDKAFGNIKKAVAADNKLNRAPVIALYRRAWFQVASVIVLLLSTAVFFLFHQKGNITVANNGNNIAYNKAIMPGHNNAVLTLSDGSTIVLDSAANGVLTQQGNMKVLKLNGQIAYNKAGADINGKPVYNTIATANGNQYQLILADGTKVWLNAASSIRFPTAFAGNERSVEITGEAYFEVAKNPAKPFRVTINKLSGNAGEVEVLGTHFNVNAYADEPDIKTTLLEGSVKIKNAHAMQMLAPGQQAQLTAGNIIVDKNVDVAQVVAWKDGFFYFDNTDLHTIMRQIARWYDVEVDFTGKITEDSFTGKISRNVPLAQLLQVLTLNDVHFKIEGKKITVMP